MADEFTEAFHTTHWSVVMEAKNDHTVAHDALNQLCRTYWYPLYAFARRKGNSHHDAQDLTQGYLAYLLEKDALQHVAPEKGKFRSFLLTSLKNYMTYEWRKSNAAKRGAAYSMVSMDEEDDGQSRYESEPANMASPEELFDRAWAASVIEAAMARLGAEHRSDQKRQLFESLQPYLSGSGGLPSYADVAKTLDTSVGSVTTSVHRMRRRFGELLRAEVAHTVLDPSEVDSEMQVLFAALGG